ncbi:ferritin-like domain-containing protein [Sphingomonas sp. CJ20]
METPEGPDIGQVKLSWIEPASVLGVRKLVQGAIDIEFATLPPYLYASMTILPETNAAAKARLQSILMQEMVHMCLACNIMNAIGGTVRINAPTYPGHLPGDVGGKLVIHLYPFSLAAMAQGMAIEKPLDPVQPRLLKSGAKSTVTIGEYYERLKVALRKLPASAWKPNRNQVNDGQFFQGQVFAVNNCDDACRAIDEIVSEGEGTPVTPENKGSPLDFQNELAHFYRFWEIYRNQVIEKDVAAGPDDSGYKWGGTLGVDYNKSYPAIADPETYNFKGESAAVRAAQDKCNAAYAAMIAALAAAFSGKNGQLGVGVRAMFDLRMAAIQALNTPMKNGKVAGPAFLPPKRTGTTKGAAA